MPPTLPVPRDNPATDGGGIYNDCGGTLDNASPGTGGNVYNNAPDDIARAC